MRDKIVENIREGHKRITGLGHIPIDVEGERAHRDRGVLLAVVDKLRAERRERIATTTMLGLMTDFNGRAWWSIEELARGAVVHADALMAELDKD